MIFRQSSRLLPDVFSLRKHLKSWTTENGFVWPQLLESELEKYIFLFFLWIACKNIFLKCQEHWQYTFPLDQHYAEFEKTTLGKPWFVTTLALYHQNCTYFPWHIIITGRSSNWSLGGSVRFRDFADLLLGWLWIVLTVSWFKKGLYYGAVYCGIFQVWDVPCLQRAVCCDR